jgi:hypothetical protein
MTDTIRLLHSYGLSWLAMEGCELSLPDLLNQRLEGRVTSTLQEGSGESIVPANQAGAVGIGGPIR